MPMNVDLSHVKSSEPSPLSFLTNNNNSIKAHACVRGSFFDKSSPKSVLIPSMAMSKKKKDKSSHKNKRKLEEAAPLYTEDIGTEGIKKSSSLVSAAKQQTSISQLPLPKDEDERRQKRMVRANAVDEWLFSIKLADSTNPSLNSNALASCRAVNPMRCPLHCPPNGITLAWFRERRGKAL